MGSHWSSIDTADSREVHSYHGGGGGGGGGNFYLGTNIRGVIYPLAFVDRKSLFLGIVSVACKRVSGDNWRAALV